MSVFHCEICGHKTHKKYNFTKHLQSKKHIKLCGLSTASNGIQRHPTAPNGIQRHSDTKEKWPSVKKLEFKDILDTLKKGNEESEYECKYCNNKFSIKKTFRNHLRDICLLVPNDLKCLLKYKQESNKNYKGDIVISNNPILHPSNILHTNQNNTYNITITNNNNNINNTTSNNNQQNIMYDPSKHLKINPMFYESTSHLTDEDKLDIIYSKPDSYDIYLDKLYKNKQNKNAMITNRREKIIKYVDKRGNLRTTDCNKMISRMVNINVDKLEEIAEDMKDKISARDLRKFKSHYDKYYDDDEATCKRLDKQTYIKLLDISNASKDNLDNFLKVKDENGREHIIVEVIDI